MTEYEQYLIDYLTYDPNTGIIIWKKSPHHTIPVGTIAGAPTHGYIDIKANYKSKKAHLIAWFLYYGEWPTKYIDHINGIRNDNRIHNLRNVSKRGNAQNRPEHRAGKLPGIKFYVHSWRSLPWMARIQVGPINVFLGYYKTQEEAYAVYCKACDNIPNLQKRIDFSTLTKKDAPRIRKELDLD